MRVEWGPVGNYCNSCGTPGKRGQEDAVWGLLLEENGRMDEPGSCVSFFICSSCISDAKITFHTKRREKEKKEKMEKLAKLSLKDYDPTRPRFLYVYKDGQQGTVECECGAHTNVVMWSFAGTGRKCSGCSRILGSTRWATSEEELKVFSELYAKWRMENETKTD